MLELSSNLKAAHRASSRKGYTRSSIDVDLNRTVLKRLTPEQHSDAVNFLIGKHVTNDALCHYSRRSISSKCPLCDMKDSRLHRIFECPALDDIRTDNKELLRWVQTQDETFQRFASLEVDLRWADDFLHHSEVLLPEVTVSDHVPAKVFTDGSAVFTGSFVTAQGAGAYVCCQHDTVIESKAYILPGPEQSAYRAEIWAFVLALQRFQSLHVYSDCAAMIQVAQGLIAARNHNTLPHFGDNQDLWRMAWTLLQQKPRHAVEISKVRAHTQWRTANTDLERWQGCFNDKADKLAKRCVNKEVASHRKDLQTAIDARKKAGDRLYNFFCMWHKMNRRCLIANNGGERDRFATEPTFYIPAVPERATILTCQLLDADIRACPLGAEFGVRLQNYFHGLAWDFQAQAVSIHELFADFTIATGTFPPVLCHVGVHSKKGPKQTYNLADQSIAADVALRQLSLADMIRTWRTAIRWLLRADAAPRKGPRSTQRSTPKMPSSWNRPSVALHVAIT
eukprot:Skav202251  [mRNA]  locus=scaffold1417:291309:294146:- [translate_table: standard]